MVEVNNPSNAAVTWVHTADLHLGQPIKGLQTASSTLIGQRLTEYLETFTRIIELVQTRKPTFLFIAGDFLEHGYVDLLLLSRVQELLASIPDTRVLYCAR